MTADLTRAIGMLKLSNADLVVKLTALAVENPCLMVTRPRPDPALALFTQQAADMPFRKRSNAPPPPMSSGAGLAVQTQVSLDPGLHEYLLRECRLMLREPDEIAIAEQLIFSVEATGWLGRPLDEIAHDCHQPFPRVEAVLLRLQQIEPAGLFARSLSECLTLQAADRGILTPALTVVLENLSLLAEGRLEELSCLAGVSERDVAAILLMIRGLDPKPGLQFDGGAPVIAPPDLILRRLNDGWEVELNRSTLPRVKLSDVPQADAADVRAAMLIVRAVDRRNATLLRVGHAALKRQHGWLKQGEGQLLPMTFADLGRELDLHETTIGRVVADRLMTTPRGTITLRALFSNGVGMPGREPVSAAALRHRVGALIADEQADNPLTDKAIAERLRSEGLPLARRTVTKYREMLGIPPASVRSGTGAR